MLQKITLAVLLAVFALATVPAISAAKAKSKSATNHARLGTTQMSGENAKLGVTYTLGKVNPINITLDKAEYTTEPVLFGTTDVWPNKTQKFLVLHYTLHNPNPRDFGLAWSTLKFDAVDANDKNWSYVGDIAVESTHEKAYMSLKRAQKTHIYTAILVPAQGEIPKLIIQSPDKLVLRYDLRGKVTPLPASLADPSDRSGATILEKASAQMGVFYPLRGLHARLESIAFSTGPVRGKAPKRGSRYLVVIGTAKNNMPHKARFVWSTLTPKLMDTDGGEIRWNGEVLFASRDDTINSDMDPNQDLRFRYVFEVPTGVQPKTFTLAQGGDSHAFAFDLSQVQ